jgi:LDH2 family malate/lactate/ureidoglycolate dehydrogenase
MTAQRRFQADDLKPFIVRLFVTAGQTEKAATRVVDALIEADFSGRGSHGILQADGYIVG